MRKASVIDEKQDYRGLLYSVKSTEKFDLAGIDFNLELAGTNPPRVQISIPIEKAPVYDAGNDTFAELYFKQQLKKGDTVVAEGENVESYSWKPDAFDSVKDIRAVLPPLKTQPPAGEYDLYVTVQDRVSNVSETKKIGVKY